RPFVISVVTSTRLNMRCWSRRLLQLCLHGRDHVVRAHREAAVVANRLELVRWDAGLEHQHVAKLAVTVLLDDEDDLVPVEEAADLVAEREPADAHVVERQAFRGEEIERLEA